MFFKHKNTKVLNYVFTSLFFPSSVRVKATSHKTINVNSLAARNLTQK